MSALHSSAMTAPDNAPPPVVPAITDRRALTAEYRRLARLRKQLAREGAPFGKRLGAFLGWAFARLMTLFPARIITHYMFHGGPLMAAGLAYQLLFASTALLVIGFSLLGMILGSDSTLQQSLVQGIGQAVPGLLDVGDGRGGVIPLALLENTAPFTVASGIASGVLVFTAWRWIAGIRLATRRMFELPPAPGMPIAAVPRDLAWLAVIGLLLLSSAAISVFASGAVETVMRWLEDSGWIEPQAWLDGGLNVLLAVGVGFVVDLLMSFALVRGVSQLKLHRKAMVVTVLVGAIGSQVLRFAGGEIIARTTNNPYLFSFAVLVGVLLWFNLYGQILLLAAASGALVQADIRGARAQPERETRAVTVVAASSLPTASRGLEPYGSATPSDDSAEDRGQPAGRDGSTASRPDS
ncbi:YihY/virulence factor BrkB family protein [Kocuria sp. cx-116]|uniref:YihY/virulence factor BrkB family protein n=1 Tax=Kocuria sp. cx-116 TaxID=2771378 RepID=UPI002A4E1ACB|nr:YihY/virulence factor BrkB family protein [Kocuria sp. cx-116]